MFLRPSFLVAIVASVLISAATEVSAKDFQSFSTGIDSVQFTDGGGRQLKGSKSCKASRRLNGKVRRAKSTGGGSSFCCEEGDWFCACISFFYSLFSDILGGRRLGEGTCMTSDYDEAFSMFRNEALQGLQESGLFTTAGNIVLSCVNAIVPIDSCDFAEIGEFILEKTEEEWQTILEEAKAEAKETLGDCVSSEGSDGDIPDRRLASCVDVLKRTIIVFFNEGEVMFPSSVSSLVSTWIHYIPIGFMLNGGVPIDDEETSQECTEDA